MELIDLVNKIKENDFVLGELAGEALESANSSKFMAALCCLFVLMEHSIKLASDNVNGNLSNQVVTLEKQGIISPTEANDFNLVRQIRNKLFHENNYKWSFEDEEEKANLFSEPETREKIWNSFSRKIFVICLKLLTQP